MNPSSQHVTVLGAGLMGAGIAQVFAAHGITVTLFDIASAQLERALASIQGNLQVMADKGLVGETERAALMARVSVQTDLPQALARATLVVEAVSESVPIKTELFRAVLQHAPESAQVWSNTSTLDVFALAPTELLPRLLIAHWFAPAHILPLVEVVASEAMAPEARDSAVALLRSLGKAPVLLKRFVPGFLINRFLRALGREAFHLLDEGVIDAADLDQAVRTSLAPRMVVLGVMQRYDFTGLDLSAKNLANPEFSDAPVNLAPRELIDRVQAGELGVKTGKGFYDYGQRSTLELSQRRDALLWDVVNGCDAILHGRDAV